MQFIIQLIILIAIEIVAVLLMPHAPPPQQPGITKEPTADASRPIPWPFGTITVDGTNVLWCGDVSTYTYTTTG